MDLTYYEKAKMIKPYVTINFSVTKRKKFPTSEKRFISKYWNLLYGKSGITKTVGLEPKIYKTKVKKNLDTAKKIAGIPKGYGAIKAVPIMTLPGRKTRIRIVKDKIYISDAKIGRTIRLFNQASLAKNYEKEIDRVTIEGAEIYHVLCGSHIYYGEGFGQREDVKQIVNKFMNKYNVEEVGENKRWENWLRGVMVYTYKSQNEMLDFASDFAEAQRKSKLNRKNAARRKKYAKKNRRNRL